MIDVPLHRKIDWKPPPLIALLLAVMNLGIFLLWQLDDHEEFVEASTYYQESGLYDLEKVGYVAYLKEQGDVGFQADNREEIGFSALEQFVSIQTDSLFLQRLHSGEVINPGDEVYPDWQEKRVNLESLYEEITSVGYGLRTGKFSWLTLFTHMFLHAGFIHLIGSLLFLIAVGILVEDMIGKVTFLGLYLISGLGAAGFDLLFNAGSLIPGIGASGAISGLIGMSSVLYGFRKVRFFYSIGIYFDYVALSAIVLLPLWIGSELLLFLLYSDTQINYLAHLGGLITGAAITAFLKYATELFDLDFINVVKKENEVKSRLESARALFNAMEYRKAVLILRRLFREGYSEREIVYLYYQSSRLLPESSDFHKAARAIFSLRERDSATARLVRETYHDYIKMAKPRPKINEEILCSLARRFVEQKWCEEADKIMPFLCRKKVACLHGNDLAYRYAELLEAQGRAQESAQYMKMIR